MQSDEDRSRDRSPGPETKAAGTAATKNERSERSEREKSEAKSVPRDIGRNILWLPGVSRNVSVAHMKEIMGTFGPVSVEIEKSKTSVEHNFTLTFETEEQGIEAQKFMNDGQIDGQRVNVQFARNKGRGRRDGDRKRDGGRGRDRDRDRGRRRLVSDVECVAHARRRPRSARARDRRRRIR